MSDNDTEPGKWIDLGDDHALQWIRWVSDPDLNPHYAGIPDVEKHAAHVRHNTPTGDYCMGYITIESETARRVSTGNPTWDVESWDPLTLSPSLLCSCGDHGFIRDGRWVRA